MSVRRKSYTFVEPGQRFFSTKPFKVHIRESKLKKKINRLIMKWIDCQDSQSYLCSPWGNI